VKPSRLLQQLLNYGHALAKHARGGFRVTPPETIAARLAICQACPDGRFTGTACDACGCQVSAQPDAFRNKLAMATEACPLGHWKDVDSPQRPLLTVGMAVYDDFDGAYFTLRALDLYHPHLRGRWELLVIDNHPQFPSPDPARAPTCSERLRDLCANLPGARYEQPPVPVGTSAPRDAVFNLARGEVVICVDSHVLLAPGAIDKTLQWLGDNPDFHGLFQGPLLYDNNEVSTHMDRVWSDQMLGVWGTSDQYEGPNGRAFPIDLQGLGLFGCRRGDWLGFNRRFREFGGEEGYIHDKYRLAGREVVCLPWLEWAHRFHAGPIKYPASIRERIKNYLRGRIELGQDIDDIHEHFFGGRDNQGPRYRPEEWADILREVQAEEGQS
jgi:hypothetical protein